MAMEFGLIPPDMLVQEGSHGEADLETLSTTS
jgi:hypothetical protein